MSGSSHNRRVAPFCHAPSRRFILPSPANSPIDFTTLFPPFTATYQKTVPKPVYPRVKVWLMLELATANHPRIDLQPISANKRLNSKSASFLIFPRPAETAPFLPAYRLENKPHNPKSASFLIFSNSASVVASRAFVTHAAAASETATETRNPKPPMPLHCHKGSYKIPLSRVEPLPFGMAPGTEMIAAEKLVRARYETSSGPESVR